MPHTAYDRLIDIARRACRCPADAEDLLQDALIEALRVGRDDFSRLENRRWLYGVVRNKARMLARSATRRRLREQAWSQLRPEASGEQVLPIAELLIGLPPALKSVAALALTGHNRREIAWLLRLDDTALRQRISQLRRRFAAAGFAMPSGIPGLGLDLAYGRIREALLPELLRQRGSFASHDPDGHLMVFVRSQNHNRRQL